MNLFYSMAFLLALVIIELLIIHFYLKEPIPWSEVILNMNSGHIFLWVSRGLEATGYYFLLTHLSFGWVQKWPMVYQCIFVLFAWDFCFYWYHRMHHTFYFLWSIHAVHHEGEHYGLSLGIRNSWYSAITTLPFFSLLAFAGVSFELFMIFSTIHYTIQIYNHNHIVKKSGWLEYILITPSHHRVHHGYNPEYRDKNCGGTFIIWDKLFGTFQKERDDIEIMYGVKNARASTNPFWTNTVPFLKYFKIKVPKLIQNERKNGSVGQRFMIMGALMLFVLLLTYIYLEPTLPAYGKLELFGIILLGTIFLSGLEKGFVWATIGWLNLTLIFVPLFVYSNQLYAYAPLSCFILFSFSGLDLTRRLLFVRKPSFEQATRPQIVSRGGQQNLPKVKIEHISRYLPESKITSEETELLINQNEQRITSGGLERIFGIRERRIAREMQASDLAVSAAKTILEKIDRSKIECLIFAAASGDLIEPATANIVQHKLGLTCPVMDIKNACNSFVNALQVGSSFIQSGQYKNVLIVTGEVLHNAIKYNTLDEADFKKRLASFTLGDAGAAAYLVASDDESGFLHQEFRSAGQYWDLCTIPGGGSMFPHEPDKCYFEGHTAELKDVMIVEHEKLLESCLHRIGWQLSDIDWIFTHQVSLGTFHVMSKNLAIPIEKFVTVVDKYGNTAAASIPLAIVEAWESGKLKKGDKVIVMGLAAGISIGVQAIIW